MIAVLRMNPKELCVSAGERFASVRPACVAAVVSVMELELRGGFGPNDEKPKSRLQRKKLFVHIHIKRILSKSNDLRCKNVDWVWSFVQYCSCDSVCVYL